MSGGVSGAMARRILGGEHNQYTPLQSSVSYNQNLGSMNYLDRNPMDNYFSKLHEQKDPLGKGVYQTILNQRRDMNIINPREIMQYRDATHK